MTGRHPKTLNDSGRLRDDEARPRLDPKPTLTAAGPGSLTALTLTAMGRPKVLPLSSEKGMPMQPLVLSSDSHVFEPPDLWRTRIDAAFRDRAPRIERIDGTDQIVVEADQIHSGIGLISTAGARFEAFETISAQGRFEDVHHGGMTLTTLGKSAHARACSAGKQPPQPVDPAALRGGNSGNKPVWRFSPPLSGATLVSASRVARSASGGVDVDIAHSSASSLEFSRMDDLVELRPTVSNIHGKPHKRLQSERLWAHCDHCPCRESARY